mmetsp:Transcript_6044/g.10100  ORF Transcript_6044/g.10100 Transcript_6044/m.10100 type:complete len:103 (-) Transcript_6044:459-767(-)
MTICRSKWERWEVRFEIMTIPLLLVVHKAQFISEWKQWMEGVTTDTLLVETGHVSTRYHPQILSRGMRYHWVVEHDESVTHSGFTAAVTCPQIQHIAARVGR